MKLSDAAHKVIDWAGKVRAYYDAELPKRHPQYPFMSDDEITVPPPSEEKKLRTFLGTLPDDTIYQLLLLMYFGRGGFGLNELADQYQELKNTYGSGTKAASVMMTYAPLADHLAEGLEELHRRGIDVNQLSWGKVQRR